MFFELLLVMQMHKDEVFGGILVQELEEFCSSFFKKLILFKVTHRLDITTN